MSTTGDEASSDRPTGADADRPATEYPRREPAGRSSARDARRRVSERLSEAADSIGDGTNTGRVPGVPRTSPWQRSNAVWHSAGIDWSRPGRERPPATRTYPVVPASEQGGAEEPAPGEDEPWGPERTVRRLPDIPLRFVAAVAVAAVVLGGGAYLLFSGGHGTPAGPAASAPAAVAADGLFAADPAATSGRIHTLDGVAAADRTVVAIGSEQGGVYSRARFLVSADGGHGWRVARVTAPAGDPPPGEYPRLVAGGDGAWTALGGVPDGGVVAWTSRDALAWTRQTASGFVAGDQVAGLARTASGFVAVGSARSGKGSHAVMWTSRDGRGWTRNEGESLAPPDGGTVTGLRGVAAFGDTVVMHGTLRTTAVVRNNKKKVQRTTEAEAFWRSPDGGRAWSPVTIPQAQGSSGHAVAAVATRAGLFVAREASHATGRKKNRKTVRYAVIFGSRDGQTWAPVGRLSPGGYQRLGGLRGDPSGLTALVPVSGGKTAVLTSGDGATWRQVADLPGGRAFTGAALAPQGPVVTGRVGDQAYLTVAGASDVNLAAVPDALHTQRAVAGITAVPGEVVAVGSAGGRAALWTSPDGSAWSRVALPAPSGHGAQSLTDAVHGPRGWLAGVVPMLTSQDGRTWRPVTGAKALGGAFRPAAAAASGSAYVVVGRASSSAGAAYSKDLRSWSSARGADKKDLAGVPAAPTWMTDVVAGQGGFVAVGGRTGKGGSVPAVWTSPDGRTWTRTATPPALPAGATSAMLTRVVARGGVLVATGEAGTSAFAAVSSDGGHTWRPASLPGAVGASITAATATAHGFVLAGTAGSDVVLWTSTDAATWQAVHEHGTGLDGPGVQRLNGLTVIGTDLVAVGFTGDQRADESTLWRRPIP